MRLGAHTRCCACFFQHMYTPSLRTEQISSEDKTVERDDVVAFFKDVQSELQTLGTLLRMEVLQCVIEHVDRRCRSRLLRLCMWISLAAGRPK